MDLWIALTACATANVVLFKTWVVIQCFSHFLDSFLHLTSRQERFQFWNHAWWHCSAPPPDRSTPTTITPPSSFVRGKNSCEFQTTKVDTIKSRGCCLDDISLDAAAVLSQLGGIFFFKKCYPLLAPLLEIVHDSWWVCVRLSLSTFLNYKIHTHPDCQLPFY